MKILIILSILLSSISYAQTSDQISKIEQEAEKIIKENKVPDSKLFYLYSLAARNLYKEKFNELSEKYYLKALNLTSPDPKDAIRAQMELGFVYVTQKKYSELTTLISQIESNTTKYKIEFPSDSNFNNTIKYFKVIAQPDKLVNESIKQDYSIFFNTPYNEIIVTREFEIRMQRSMFKEALAIFQGDRKPENGYYDYQVAYDLLKIISKEKDYTPVCKINNQTSGILVDLCQQIHNKLSNQQTTLNIQKLMKKIESNKNMHYLLPSIRKALY